jgi:NAD+ synthase (glutamine-hydrolysing)
MRIALAQINYHIGHFEYNFYNICRAIEEAKSQHADLVVFGELSICGYPPRDFLEFDDFVKQCETWIEKLLPFSQDIGVLVGGPSVNPQIEGKDLFNSAWLLYQGEVVFKAHKSLLPNYDIFDEYRYFEPATTISTVAFRGRLLAITICEDLWNIGNENPLYPVCPMDVLLLEKPEIIINLSASPFSYQQAAERKRIIRENAKTYQLPVFYANHVGAQTEIIFDGGSLAVSPDGSIYEELPYFDRQVQTFDVDKVIAGHGNRELYEEKTALIYRAIITGIREYIFQTGL